MTERWQGDVQARWMVENAQAFLDDNWRRRKVACWWRFGAVWTVMVGLEVLTRFVK